MENYFEEKLSFIENKEAVLSRNFGAPSQKPEILGLSIRIGNEPIVRNLKKLYELSNKSRPSELQVLFDNKDIYMIVHAIGAIRLEGKAKVDELQYHAQISDLPGAQTIDLLPNTTFRNPSIKENTGLKIGFEGTISASGNFSSIIPEYIIEYLTGQQIKLGSDISLKLSAYADLIGLFTYNCKFPVVQSLGISSNSCIWVLNPQDYPLLGDQLFIQTLAVPKGTKKVCYKVQGVCKADKGLFWKKQTLKTAEYVIEVELV